MEGCRRRDDRASESGCGKSFVYAPICSTYSQFGGGHKAIRPSVNNAYRGALPNEIGCMPSARTAEADNENMEILSHV
jgi:hypothetical protein